MSSIFIINDDLGVVCYFIINDDLGVVCYFIIILYCTMNDIYLMMKNFNED
ncbi:MAG: hypothetical protein IJ187_09140 [Neisseriaceae bacterium]|nr:hypothetical protein [Neisseriaceae bacterium]